MTIEQTQKSEIDFPTADTLDRLRDELESLCRQIAPRELSDRPIYTVWSSSLVDVASGTVGGCVEPNLDLIARESIGDRWQGRGPAIMLNDHRLWYLAAKAESSREIGHLDARIKFRFEQICRAIAVHEFGHIAEDGFSRPEVTAPERWMQKPLMQFKVFLRTTETVLPPKEKAADQKSHGAAFIRAALHVNHRAMKALDRSNPVAAMELLLDRDFLTLDLEQYGLSACFKYARALGDEPERMEAATFAEILARPAPAAFTELFNADDQARRKRKS
jgi:hypothetical protein